MCCACERSTSPRVPLGSDVRATVRSSALTPANFSSPTITNPRTRQQNLLDSTLAAERATGFSGDGDNETETEEPDEWELLVLLPRRRTGASDRQPVRDATADGVRTTLSPADRHADAKGLQWPQVPKVRSDRAPAMRQSRVAPFLRSPRWQTGIRQLSSAQPGSKTGRGSPSSQFM